MEVHLQTLLDAATTHQASLAPATLTQATTLKNNWVTIYQASEASTGAKTVTQEGKKLARENLQLMLFLNSSSSPKCSPASPRSWPST